MTRRLLEATRFIAVVALGEGMDNAIRSAAGPRPPNSESLLFAADIRPLGGEFRWYLEEGACENAPGLPPIPLE
jgi:hypothetical protein